VAVAAAAAAIGSWTQGKRRSCKRTGAQCPAASDRPVTEALIMAAEDRGPLMHAQIGMLRALNHHVGREFNPDRKDTHWGKRKLKRDRSVVVCRPMLFDFIAISWKR
jgi:hypothetical protein